MPTLLGTNGTGFAGPDGVGFGVSDSYPAYTAPGPAVPLLRYAGADLPATSGVNRWPNSGGAGAAYDAAPAANMVAPARTTGPGTASAVRFVTGDLLSSPLLSDSYEQGFSLLLLANVLGNTATFRSIAGLGRAQQTGDACDVLVSGSIQPYYLEFINNAAQASAGSLADWFSIAFSVRPLAGRQAQVTGYLNGQLVVHQQVESRPLDSGLMLGGGAVGMYYQNRPPFALAHAELYLQALADADLLGAEGRMRALYGL